MKDLYSYLLPWLEDTDVTTWSFVLSTITITIVAYTLVFIAVCIASFFLERFLALGDAEKLLWCIKGTKVFHLPIPVFTGLWYLLVDNTLKDDVVNGTTETAFVALYIHVGFNLLDSVLIATGRLLYGNRFSTALLIHHFIVLCMCSVIMYYSGKGHYFILIGFIEDMTSLSCINWMLAKARLTHLSIWKMNQQIFVYLWYFRTMLEFYLIYVMVKNWNCIWNEMPVPLLITNLFGVLLMAFGLTPRWTKVEAKRLYRQFSRRSTFILKPQEKNKP